MKKILSYPIAILCILVLNLKGTSQSNNTLDEAAEAAIDITDRFQTFILTSNLAELQAARESVAKLALSCASYDTLHSICYYMSKQCRKKCKLEEIKQSIKTKYPKTIVPDLINEDDLYSVQYLGRVMIALLQHHTDYSSVSDTSRISKSQAALFYDIQDGQSILEIGAGLGTEVLLTCALNSECNIFMNELDERKITFARAFFDQNRDIIGDNKIHYVQGDKKHTGTDIKVDKIIMVNTYHHFTKQKQMLKSIKGNLKPNGILYLKEHVKLNGESGCRFALPMSEIIFSIIDQGFELIEKQSKGMDVLLSFRLNELPLR